MGLSRFRVLCQQRAQGRRQEGFDSIQFGVRDRHAGEIVRNREVFRLARRGFVAGVSHGFHDTVIAPAAPSVLVANWSGPAVPGSAFMAARAMACPENPPADVIDFPYTGNRLHPTQKPVAILKPLIEAFCPAGGLVLDPFCGSGSTLVAARDAECEFVGIELDRDYHRIASRRLAA